MRHKKSFLGTILVFIIGYVLCTPARAYEPSAVRPAQPPITAVADESSSLIASTNRIENERVPEATVPAVTVTSTTIQVAKVSSSSVESLSCREKLLNWSKRPGGRAIAVKMHLGKATEAKCFSSVIEANEYWGRKFNAMDLVPLAMSIQACESLMNPGARNSATNDDGAVMWHRPYTTDRVEKFNRLSGERIGNNMFNPHYAIGMQIYTMKYGLDGQSLGHWNPSKKCWAKG